MKTERMTTTQLSQKARNGFIVLVNGVNKSYLQLNNMKSKTYTVIIEDKTIKTINYQTL